MRSGRLVYGLGARGNRAWLSIIKNPVSTFSQQDFWPKACFFMYMCQEQPIKSWTFPIILNSNLISRTIWHLVKAEKAPSSLFVSILHLMPQGSWKEQVQLEDVSNLVFPLLTFIYILHYSTQHIQKCRCSYYSTLFYYSMMSRRVNVQVRNVSLLL